MKPLTPHHKEGGYMLIEILVSLTIFSVVAVMSTASILAVISANTRAQNIKSVMDNMSVVTENISRTIRIGSDWRCIQYRDSPYYYHSSDCGQGTIGFSYIPQNAISNDSQYRVQIYYNALEHAIYRAGSINGQFVDEPLTSPDVKITAVQFFLRGADVGDGQPRVLMVINGEAGTTEKSKFVIQTTVTEREPDCDRPGGDPDNFDQPWCPR